MIRELRKMLDSADSSVFDDWEIGRDCAKLDTKKVSSNIKPMEYASWGRRFLINF